jgi:hypothetical protein
MLKEKPDGNFILGVFLIDIFCLDLKNTFFKPTISFNEFEDIIYKDPDHTHSKIDIDHAHSIIYGGIDYVENLGFKSHSDFKVT